MENLFSRESADAMEPLWRNGQDEKDCAEAFPTALAMAYVRCQSWRTTYDPETALSRGTMFPELDKPFIGEEAVAHGRT